MNVSEKPRKRVSETNHVNFGFDDQAELTGEEEKDKKADEFYSGMDEGDNTFAYSFGDSDRAHLTDSEADRLSCWKQCVHGVRCKLLTPFMSKEEKLRGWEDDMVRSLLFVSLIR